MLKTNSIGGGFPSFSLHPKSTGLADEGELGFMKSVEAQFEKIVVAKAKGAGEQTGSRPMGLILCSDSLNS